MTLIQFVAASIFLLVVLSLIFTRVRASLVFVSAVGAYFLTSLVPAETILRKATNAGLATLVILLLVSLGLEKARWLWIVADRLINGPLNFGLLRLAWLIALSLAFLNTIAR